jgi:hypothetical protein
MYYFSAKINQCIFWMEEQRRERSARWAIAQKHSKRALSEK